MIINDPVDIIFETIFWLIKIDSTDQTYLGRSMVICKRKCGDISQLTDEELLDWKRVVEIFQDALMLSFGATMFNWTCLMNSAYQNRPPDPLVHWHVRPRYKDGVTFEGELFRDTAFGSHYLRGTNRIVSLGMKEKIITAIKKSLK